MAFVNSYKAPTIQKILKPADGPYDINFNAPLPEIFETDRVRLAPFIPSIHAKPFNDAYNRYPEVEKYLPISWTDYSDFLTSLEYLIRSDPSSVMFAIIDRTKPNDGANLEESLAGVIGYINCSPYYTRAIEIGPVIIFPPFQRTFISSHAIGLELKYALDLPSEGGLGFRRVVWTANPNNEASIRAAQRMGFEIEGVTKWSWILTPEKTGGKPVDEKRGVGQGRDSTVLSLCWDSWESGGRELVQKTLDRQ